MTKELNALGQPVGVPLREWTPASSPTSEPIVGRYCRLQRLDADAHAGDLFEANAIDRSGANWTYLPYGPFGTLADYSAWVVEVSTSVDPMFFAIIDGSTDRAAGVASLLRIVPDDGSIEVGHINFSPLLQRTRAATEAMYLLMSNVFDDWGYRRYEWKCNSLNAPSVAAARRLGFTYEGTHRNSKVVKGRNRDTSWFSIIAQEWPDVRNRMTSWLNPENFDDAGRQRTSLERAAFRAE
jgi:RimJ/RimL family protein N-acetyltransferase